MDDKNGFVITNRDRVLRAWQNSTELVRDYSRYANETKHNNRALADMFAKFSEHEAEHASKLLEVLQGYED